MMATNRLPPNNRRYKTSVPFNSLFQRRYFLEASTAVLHSTGG